LNDRGFLFSETAGRPTFFIYMFLLFALFFVFPVIKVYTEIALKSIPKLKKHKKKAGDYAPV